MALSKDVDNNNSGVIVSYWRITKIDTDLIAKTTRVILSGYTSKSARDSGKSSVTERMFFWTGNSNPVTKIVLESGNSLTACYEKIKHESAGIGNPNTLIFVNSVDI